MGDRFHNSVLVLSCFAFPLFAQSSFTVTPSQIPGIEIHGPDTPEFAQHLSQLGVDAPTNVLPSTALSRAIVVTNATDRPVAKFVVRFEYLNQAGKMTSLNQWQEPREGFAPGTSRLVTVSQTLTESIRSHWPEQSVLQAARAPMSAAIVASPLLRLSLDAVLFADGEFFGPDVSGAWTMLFEELEFVRATRSELESMGTDMARVQEKLDELHKPTVDRKPVPGQGMRVTMMREKMYGELIDLAKRGYEPFRAALQERFGESTLPGLKKKF